MREPPFDVPVVLLASPGALPASARLGYTAWRSPLQRGR